MKPNNVNFKSILLIFSGFLLNIALCYILISAIDSLYAKAGSKTDDVLELAKSKTIIIMEEIYAKYFGENLNGEQRIDDANIVKIQNEFDVQNYDLTLSFDIPKQSIIGTMVMTCKTVSDTLNTIYLNLYSNMIVRDVQFIDETNTKSDVAFTQENNYLIIKLNKTSNKEQTFAITVKYDGYPKPMGYDSFVFKDIYGNPVIYSLSEPTYGPTWWPSKDLPDDKATTSMHLIVPRGLTGVSNGILLDTVQNSDGTTTFTWKTNYPVATYLISIVVTRFTFAENTYTSLDSTKTMPVVYYLFPNDSSGSSLEWRRTPEMIHFYSSVYGEYPFINEKYGMAEFGWTEGSMENQTITSMGYRITNSEEVIVHELSHQWFGDAVTLKDWKNIWLNEGFATYSEALWDEHKGGKNSYLSYFRRTDYEFTKTLYNPDGYMFSPPVYATVYQKGGWVLHMLRGVLGDSLFFQTLRTYFDRFKYKNADTKDFQAVAEEMSTQYLDWFFDEWVYTGIGRPKYEYSWKFEDFQDQTNSGTYTVKLQINQVQDDREVYKMPMEITIVTENGESNFPIYDERREQSFVFAVNSKPKEVILVKEGWILKRVAKGKY